MSYAMPQTGFVQEGFSGAPPLFALPRRWTWRVVIIVLGGPIVLGCFVGAVASIANAANDPSSRGAAIALAGGISVVGALLALLFGWLFLREMRRSAAVYEQGIELKAGSKVTAIRWTDVAELFIQATIQRAGGLVGMAAGAIADRMKKDQPLPETAQVVVTVKATDGRTLKLTSMDKGVIRAYQEACRRVNPRLVEAAVKAVQNGGTATFGKITLSSQGISFGNKAPTPYGDITSLGRDNGTVVAKKEGKWLSLGSQLVARTPNVYVLSAVFARLASGGATGDDASNVVVGREIAGRQYVSG